MKKFLAKTSIITLIYTINLLSLIILTSSSSYTSDKKLKFLSDIEKKNDPINPTTTKEYSIYYDETSKKYTVKETITAEDDALATAVYTDSLEELGWDILYLTVRENLIVPEKIQAYAAGYLEGVFTKKRIYDHYTNLSSITWKNNVVPDNVVEYISLQHDFLEEFETNHSENASDYEKTVINVFNQFKGLMQGYNENTENQRLNLVEFHTINSFGDLFDILYYKNIPSFEDKDSDFIYRYIRDNSHCSALIKLKADLSDLWFGHNSWFNFAAQTRIFKTYTFNYSYKNSAGNANTVNQWISQSSYPGTLASNDDFYVLYNDLVVIETTNPVLDPELFKKVNTQALLTWHRAFVSNLISNDGDEWADNFIKNNSGTYNNQFMILNLNKIDTTEKLIHEKALIIVEQMPGDHEKSDVTEYLRYGYWPSYNVPYSKRIRELSKYDEYIKKHPDLAGLLDYDTCSRANIFRRDSGRINSTEDFKLLMRKNQYKTDPLSKKDPSFAIASRYDLHTDSKKRSCSGAYDTKVGSIKEIKGVSNQKLHIIQGPTHDDQEPLNWKTSEACKDISHVGFKDVFDYDWTVYDLKNSKS